jgi:hypothetical protein
MNSYLHHLTSRALDAVSVLKPRLPSWFEPVSPGKAVLQEISQDALAPTHPVRAPSVWPPPQNMGFSATFRPLPAPEPLPTPNRPTESDAIVLQQPGAQPGAGEVRVEHETHERHEVLIEHRIEEKRLSTASATPEPRSAERRETVGLTKDPRSQNPDLPPAQIPFSPANLLPRSLVPVATIHTVHQEALPAVPEPASPPPPRENKPLPVATLVPKPVPPPAIPEPVSPPPPRENKPLPVAALVPKPVPPPAMPVPRSASILRGEPVSLPFEPEAPSIQVTIGRVEVRAVSSPPPAAAPRSRPAAPMLSLEDYLKQKDGRSL